MVPKLKHMNFRKPVLTALAVFATAQILLLLNPGQWALVPGLILSVALEAAAISVLNPMTNSLLFINAEEDERARVCGMVFATVALLVTIFPAMVGRLAQISLFLPFVINLCLFAVAAFLTVWISRVDCAQKG